MIIDVDTSEMTTAVVVLNWNNAADTLACLASLRASTVLVTVIVVDNGSVDTSADQIEASGLADTLIRTGTNLGYAGGNNAGITHALTLAPDMLMVLNNDTIVRPDMVRRLQAELAAGAPRTVVSPRIVYHGSNEEVWFAGGVLDRGCPRHLQAGELPEPEMDSRASDLLTGCCLAARARTWERIGLFDERYFLIFEDSDWSMRARQRGARLVVCDQAVLEHRVSRSFRTGPASLLSSYYYARNGLRFHLTWQRTHTLHFVVQRVIRPLMRSAYRKELRRPALFALAGAVGCVMGHGGRAGAITQRWASRLVHDREAG